MRLARHLYLVVTFISSGCVCMFVPCDRSLHVSGHVFDAQHKPVVNATIEFYGERNRQMTTAVSISEDYWQRQVLCRSNQSWLQVLS